MSAQHVSHWRSEKANKNEQKWPRGRKVITWPHVLKLTFVIDESAPEDGALMKHLKRLLCNDNHIH
jgi:hypothetical protein